MEDLPDPSDVSGEIGDGLAGLAEQQARQMLTEDVVRDLSIVAGSVLVGTALVKIVDYSQNRS